MLLIFNPWIEYLAIFIFGTIIGSFLNVVIYRVPAGISLIKPDSHCPVCKRPIKPWENVPILSYVFLRGKCAGCRTKISVKYPLIEALTGFTFALILSKVGWSENLIIYCVMAAVLISLSIIDIQTMRLPNSIVLTGSIFAVILNIIFRTGNLWEFIMTLIGGAVGLGLLALMGLLGALLFRKDTLGMGDIKLAGMIGLFVGPYHAAGMYILGIFTGAFVGIALIITGGLKRGQRIPFGPYLALGAIISILWGEQLLRLYVSLAFR